MSHIRAQVKDALATILGTSPTTWGRVYKTRVQSTRQVWPYLMLYSAGDTTEILSVDDPIIYQRNVSIVIVGMLRMPSNSDKQTIEDKMDALSLEVETKLTSAAVRSALTGIESLSMESTALDLIVTDDDVIDHAEVTMKWNVVCANSENSPSTII